MAFRATTANFFRITQVNLKVKTSSKGWLARQTRDPYVKKRLSDPASYRSRAAFKLIEIDDEWGFLTRPHVNTIVDLGAAPGGWSQVVARKLGWPSVGLNTGEKAKRKSWSMPREDSNDFDPLNIDDMGPIKGHGRGTIFAVDLLKMEPIHGVHCIQGDFLAQETTNLLHEMLETEENPGGKVDIILSDIAPNMTGNPSADVEASVQVLEAVWKFTEQHLRTAKELNHKDGGVLLVKHFAHPSAQDFRHKYLKPHFNKVNYYKPPSSRSSSPEGYFLCQGFRKSPQEDATPKDD